VGAGTVGFPRSDTGLFDAKTSFYRRTVASMNNFDTTMLHCTMDFCDTARGPPFEIVASILALAVDSPQAATPL
jgi:hypothetical protein